MKKFLLSIILALSVLGVYAQAENESGKKLLFVYIAHDSNTPVQQLCDRLRSYYEEATIYEGSIWPISRADSGWITRIAP